MINVKQGTAMSLQQTNLRGNNPGAPYGTPSATVITAGTVCTLTSAGNVVAGNSTGIRGFALNNSYDGDALESGQLGLYTLDGNSILETDQVALVDVANAALTGGISLTNFPRGSALYSDAATGLVTLYAGASAANGAVIGWVEGVRSLQNASPYPTGVVKGPQNYTSATEGSAQDYAAANGLTNPFSRNPDPATWTRSSSYKAQVNVPVLSIKLAATA